MDYNFSVYIDNDNITTTADDVDDVKVIYNVQNRLVCAHLCISNNLLIHFTLEIINLKATTKHRYPKKKQLLIKANEANMLSKILMISILALKF